MSQNPVLLFCEEKIIKRPSPFPTSSLPASAYKLVIFRGRSKMIEQLNVDRKQEFKHILLDMQLHREH